MTFLAFSGAATRTYSPAGFLLIDAYTREPPAGRVSARIDRSDGIGGWIETDARGVITPSSVLAFPGLGRARDPAAPPVTHRVRVEADLYRPMYRASADGVVFPVPPYNDAEPLTLPPPLFAQLLLLPAFHYQYPSHVRLLRGEVVHAAAPVSDALVTDSVFGTSVLTDERGAFTLPLPFLADGVADTIDVSDRFGNTGALTITFPAALASGVLIPI